MGDHGTAGRRRYAQRMRGPRHGLSSEDAEKRRCLGRAFLHWNRVPARVLSDVPPVPPVFPADRADELLEGDGGEGHLAIGYWLFAISLPQSFIRVGGFQQR